MESAQDKSARLASIPMDTLRHLITMSLPRQIDHSCGCIRSIMALRHTRCVGPEGWRTILRTNVRMLRSTRQRLFDLIAEYARRMEWIHEDELPPMNDAEYATAFIASQVIDGVRMFRRETVNA